MNYLSTNEMPQGEILFKGPGVTPGYFKLKEKTDESIIDGWMYSGDVGVVYPNGAVKVIDRAKNIFKLS
jgi:long-chain acyl-CoA synthetase